VSLATAAAGVRHVAGALLVMLADQPMITKEHVDNMIDSHRDSPDRIVASSYAGTVGPPVIFPRLYFPELQVLSGDSGARRVINAHKDKLVEIKFEDAAHDIDYPEDLDRFN
jgi:molybdenum cofactor cytidylyltransferase